MKVGCPTSVKESVRCFLYYKSSYSLRIKLRPLRLYHSIQTLKHQFNFFCSLKLYGTLFVSTVLTQCSHFNLGLSKGLFPLGPSSFTRSSKDSCLHKIWSVHDVSFLLVIVQLYQTFKSTKIQVHH